jgi:glycosyltransferase involved in cell wall biosynthesis
LENVLKLTIVGPVFPYRGGIAHHTALLEIALSKAGHQTQTISFRRQYPAWLYPGKSDKDPSQKPLRTAARFILDPFYPWTWFQAAKEIIIESPNGVIIQWWTTFWAIPFAILAAKLKSSGLPVIFIIHNVLPHEQRFWDVWLSRRALSKGDAFIVQTNREKDRLKALFPASKIQVCELPPYWMFHTSKMDKKQSRKSLRLSDNNYVLLFFGFVRQYKGLDILLKALSILRKEDSFPYLIIAGEFWDDLSAYKRMIVDFSLEDRVLIDNRYIPNEEVGTYFSAADSLVAPYTGGTQSGSVSIAVSYGLPMIVTDQVAQGIAIEHRQLLQAVVPPGNVQALAEAIQAVMQKSIKVESQQRRSQGDWNQLVLTILRAIPP